MKRVLILDGSIDTAIYRPTAEWRSLLGDVPSDSVHLPSGGKVPPLTRYTHLIVTGSEASIVRPEPWFDIEDALVREAAMRGLAVLGSCFGHQMLAKALSGAEHTAASPTPEVGWIAVEMLDSDPLLEGMPNPFHVFASHFDEVRSPPSPWRVLARSPGCGVQAMRYGEKPIWGIQAHPEIPPENARILMQGFLDHHPEKETLIRPALDSKPRDDRVAQGMVTRFLTF